VNSSTEQQASMSLTEIFTVNFCHSSKKKKANLQQKVSLAPKHHTDCTKKKSAMSFSQLFSNCMSQNIDIPDNKSSCLQDKAQITDVKIS